jgi:hypothetical protein
MPWHYRGGPYYLLEQAARLGIHVGKVHRAKNNSELYKAQTLFSQLAEKFNKARKEDGKPVFGKPELDGIRGALVQAEEYRQIIYLMAGAIDSMIVEAHEAFGFDLAPRTFEILCDYDTPPKTLPFGDGTVGVADGVVGRTIAESG